MRSKVLASSGQLRIPPNSASAAATSSRRASREALTRTTSPAARWPRSQSTAASLSASATARSPAPSANGRAASPTALTPPARAVRGLAVVAELEHLAEDGEAAPAVDRRQRVQSGAGRVGVGVEGVV